MFRVRLFFIPLLLACCGFANASIISPSDVTIIPGRAMPARPCPLRLGENTSFIASDGMVVFPNSCVKNAMTAAISPPSRSINFSGSCV